MHRTTLIVSALAGALILVTWRAEVPCGDPLGDDALASVTGRDGFTGSVPADCAYGSTGDGQVISTNCPQSIIVPPDPGPPTVATSLADPAPPMAVTQCIICNSGSYNAATPPEFGGSGYKPDSSQKDCTNLWKRVGTCQPDGSCGAYRFQQFCSGTPTTYSLQTQP